MDSRERVIRAIKFRTPDHIPYEWYEHGIDTADRERSDILWTRYKPLRESIVEIREDEVWETDELLNDSTDIDGLLKLHLDVTAWSGGAPASRSAGKRPSRRSVATPSPPMTCSSYPQPVSASRKAVCGPCR